jgi:hypothetical protein
VTDAPLACLGALALELTPMTLATHLALPQQAAGALAERVALDLGRIVPEAAGLDLVLLGAHVDPVELLRPGWPLHAELDRLATRAPGAAGGRLIAFGSGADGAMPGPLAPDANLVGGALRLLPFVLRGDPALVARVGDRLEAELLETGMAGAETALEAQRGFGAQVEHARYLTVNDLAAMMAMQYEHGGLAALWPVIEAALLAPDAEEWLDAPPEPLLRFHAGEARIALMDHEAWLAGGFAPVEAQDDPALLERRFAQFEARQRQVAAVLQAHGIGVVFDHCPAGRDPREVLRA